MPFPQNTPRATCLPLLRGMQVVRLPCVNVCRARVRAAEVDFVLRACPLASASSFLHTVEKDYVQYVEAYKSDARGGGGEVSTG